MTSNWQNPTRSISQSGSKVVVSRVVALFLFETPLVAYEDAECSRCTRSGSNERPRSEVVNIAAIVALHFFRRLDPAQNHPRLPLDGHVVVVVDSFTCLLFKCAGAVTAVIVEFDPLTSAHTVVNVAESSVVVALRING